MSRDLSFWKNEEIIALKNSEIYAKLSNGETIVGLATLPQDNILKTIDNTLSNWNKLDATHYENNDELIELYITDQFVRFDCYGVLEEHMNLLIDIMLKYDCPLYDVAIDMRFS